MEKIKLVIIGRLLDGGSINYITKDESDKIRDNHYKNGVSIHIGLSNATKYWYDGRPNSKTYGKLFKGNPDNGGILLNMDDYDFLK